MARTFPVYRDWGLVILSPMVLTHHLSFRNEPIGPQGLPITKSRKDSGAFSKIGIVEPMDQRQASIPTLVGGGPVSPQEMAHTTP